MERVGLIEIITSIEIVSEKKKSYLITNILSSTIYEILNNNFIINKNITTYIIKSANEKSDINKGTIGTNKRIAMSKIIMKSTLDLNTCFIRNRNYYYKLK